MHHEKSPTKISAKAKCKFLTSSLSNFRAAEFDNTTCIFSDKYFAILLENH
jgi:hypothetical protein